MKNIFSVLLICLVISNLLAEDKYESVAGLLKKGDLISAGKALEPYEQIRDNATLLFIRGDYYLRKGRNDKAIEELKSALDLFQKQNGQDSKEYANTLDLLSIAYWNEGNSVKALEYGIEAQSLRKKLFGTASEDYAASLNNIGLIYSSSKPEEALNYYQEAISTYSLIYDASDPKIGLAHVNMGILHKNQKDYNSAIKEFEQALNIWKVAHKKEHPNSAFTHRYLAETYLEMGNDLFARLEAENALSTYSSFYGNSHPDVANAITFLGRLELKNNEIDASLSSFHRAIHANYEKPFSDDVIDSPPSKGYYNGFVLLNTLYYKSLSLERKYLSKSLKMKHLNAAINHLLVADTVINHMRRSIIKESDKIELGTLAIKIYEVGVRLSMLANSVTFSKKKEYLGKGFYFVEKSKSSVLLEAISDAKAKNFAGIPSSVLATENKLKADISFLEQKIAEKSDKDQLVKYQSTLFELDNEYEVFIQNLEKKYPKYYQLKYASSTPGLKSIQSKLAKEEALVDYFIDQSSNVLYAFYITKNNVKVQERVLTKDFDKYISGLRNGIAFHQQQIYQRSANELFEILKPTYMGKSDKVTIIPTARLGVVPFEALLTKKVNTETSYKELPFLLNETKVSYTYSSSLFVQEKNKQEIKKVLLCAPVEFKSLTSLPGTKNEVDSIGLLLKNHSYDYTSLLFADAKESKIKSLDLKEFRFLHFATHGVVSEYNPALSRIFLTGDDKDDGSLYTGELYNLKLNADLITLSACETGLGKVQKGEGVVGLSRSLLYAGAKNLLVSLWTVSDASTSQLMINLYKEILSNNVSEYCGSLQSAKQRLAVSDEFSDPYYWAPFILIGK